MITHSMPVLAHQMDLRNIPSSLGWAGSSEQHKQRWESGETFLSGIWFPTDSTQASAGLAAVSFISLLSGGFAIISWV